MIVVDVNELQRLHSTDFLQNVVRAHDMAKTGYQNELCNEIMKILDYLKQVKFLDIDSNLYYNLLMFLMSDLHQAANARIFEHHPFKTRLLMLAEVQTEKIIENRFKEVLSELAFLPFHDAQNVNSLDLNQFGWVYFMFLVEKMAKRISCLYEDEESSLEFEAQMADILIEKWSSKSWCNKEQKSYVMIFRNGNLFDNMLTWFAETVECETESLIHDVYRRIMQYYNEYLRGFQILSDIRLNIKKLPNKKWTKQKQKRLEQIKATFRLFFYEPIQCEHEDKNGDIYKLFNLFTDHALLSRAKYTLMQMAIARQNKIESSYIQTVPFLISDIFAGHAGPCKRKSDIYTLITLQFVRKFLFTFILRF